MSSDFVPLGMQSREQIEAKLREIEGEDEPDSFGLESAFDLKSTPRPWLNTQHQYGYIAPFMPGVQRYHPITSASNMAADAALKGQRINIHLGHLRVYQYPTALFNLGHSQHTILFTFEARNQVDNTTEEPVAFNQLYKARAGQDVAVIGQPIFIGLTVGNNGVGFACRTVNVSNSTDEQLVGIFNSEAVTAGLNLLTTAQPALGPLTTLARGLCVSLASHNKNVGVQDVKLGLDFETGAIGVRLAVGSYVVAQTTEPNDIVWSEWVYDAETGTIVNNPANLAQGEKPSPLPYNAFVFRISRFN